MRTSVCMSVVAAASAAFFGQSAPAPSAFEAASVKRNPAGYGSSTRWKDSPGRLHCTDVPLKWVIRRAYQVQDSQISGPAWLDTDGYDIDATFPADTGGQPKMLQALLAERFKLAVHRETKDRPVYLLVVDKGGAKLHAVQEIAGGLQMKMDGPVRHLRSKTTVAKLAVFLSDQLRLTVVDQTGLKATYDIALDFTLDESAPQNGSELREAVLPIRAAVQTQLGLQLELKKQPLEILVIDHVEKVPVEN
jgi:uncharacterized protein (TIGR03435 family)